MCCRQDDVYVNGGASADVVPGRTWKSKRRTLVPLQRHLVGMGAWHSVAAIDDLCRPSCISIIMLIILVSTKYYVN
ncbi:hypothetical protein DPMN_010449 [Dreissena polymorpha]|uniref:Uncharacterized protein n=1 Tax=Dreissena polymorpha TaxID=45954 RepID=A0A9D4RZ91_DREPO|nr:hypothetical protein DPMN_010449 [Dreissena polymorpha]